VLKLIAKDQLARFVTYLTASGDCDNAQNKVFHMQSKDQSPLLQRREQLSGLLAPSSAGVVVRTIGGARDGLVAIVPTYEAPERRETMKALLLSLARQKPSESVGKVFSRVVIADNGMAPESQQIVNQFARSVGLDVEIVNAHPQHNGQKNAAHARNVAVNRVREKAKLEPEYRGDVFFIDDDQALLGERAMNYMTRVLSKRNNGVAASLSAKEVRELNQQTYNDQNERYEVPKIHINGASEALKVFPLPPLWVNAFVGDNAGQVKQIPVVDLGPLLALGGEMAAKTNGLLIKRDVIEKLSEKGGKELFIRMDNGSFEDMWLNLMLANHGVVYRCPEVEALDLVRTSQQSLNVQQAKWGRDHVLAAHELNMMGYLKPGVTVFEPKNGRFVEWPTGAFPSNYSGVIVNPREIREAWKVLSDMLDAGTDLGSILGAPVDQDAFTDEMRRLDDWLNAVKLDADPKKQLREIRTGLPEPVEVPNKAWEKEAKWVRFSPETKAARLAGNLAGMADLRATGEVGLGADDRGTVVYCIRQPVKPKVG
jgi:hypothetical protein